MNNNAFGNIYQQPTEMTMLYPGGGNAAAHISFAGNVKVSSSQFQGQRPIDPAQRMKPGAVEWSYQTWTPLPVLFGNKSKLSYSLAGIWKFCETPPQRYWENSETPSTSVWHDVPVPGELMALGYDIIRNREYVYKKLLFIPADWEDQKILLKFGMSYEYTKIWVNGHFVRDHKGAFTSFECDITDYVTVGQEAWLTVMCMHSHDALCDWIDRNQAPIGGYAGLIDDVVLAAVPKVHLCRFYYETNFDEAYTNAFLKVTVKCADTQRHIGHVQFKLFDAKGQEVVPEQAILTLDNSQPQQTLVIPVPAPVKWDSEHPVLYRLEAVLSAQDQEELVYHMPVGFRKVERKGNALYINGMKTKLRGACLYGHDPILGKVFTRNQLEEIIKAAKWANINFLRSSAYPERAALYELCDQYGIYVEECAPVNFQRGLWDSQRDMQYRPASDLPAYTAAVMNQFVEMVERDRNHPSVLIWEYGNESDWGINFQAELDYLHKEDSTRLTAGTWNNTHTSLTSYHYPQYDEIIGNAALYDEYIHIPTHATETLKRDPGIRNAWGLSVLYGWDALFEGDGVVGAAIFAMTDYTIQRPDGTVFGASYGQWGLLDSWLREKPELWLTKKGYSPVKMPEKHISKPGKNMHLAIPVHNRYNHTNLQDIIFKWEVGKESGELHGPWTAPTQTGALLLPIREWQDGEKLHISVYEADGNLVDEVILTVGSEEIVPCDSLRSEKMEGVPSLNEDENFYFIEGTNFKLQFNKKNGLLEKSIFQGETLLQSGPFLNLCGAYYKPSVFQNDKRGEFHVDQNGWKCDSIHVTKNQTEVILTIKGTYPGGTHLDMWQFSYSYEPVKVVFTLHITGDGHIRTDYEIMNPPKEMLFEVGVSYLLSDEIDTFIWDKDSVFSVYPEDHIGRPRGVAKRYRDYGQDEYRSCPRWKWSEDETNYALYGGEDKCNHGTNDFLTARENIRFAGAKLAGKEERVRVEPDGASVAVRLHPVDACDSFPRGVSLIMNHELYYDLGNGSSAIVKSGDGYMGNYTYPEVRLTDGYHNSVVMSFTDRD